MQRRHFLRQLCVLTLAGLGLPACARSEKANAISEQGSSPIAKLNKPLSEWHQLLPSQAYALAADGIPLYSLWWSSRTRVQRWAAADGSALV